MPKNPLDEIFEDYKRNGPRRRTSFNEVPDPVFDAEFTPNSSNTRVCPSCGSFNLSIDLATNKTVCNDCHGEEKNPHRIDFQKKMEDEKEKEAKLMNDAIQRGGTFGKVN